MALNVVPIHRSVTRHTHFLGGDREIILMALVIAIAFIFILQTIMATTFGICLWAFTLWSTRIMNKADPHMRDIFLRYVKYQHYYPARSTPFYIAKK